MSKRTFPLFVAAGEEVSHAFDGDGIACTGANLDGFELGVDGKSRDKFTFGDKYFPAGGYNTFQVFNPFSTPLTCDIVAFSGEYSNEQAVTGGPQAFEPQTLQDLAGTGFLGGSTAVGAAASVPFVRFWNPLASGVTTVIRRLWVQQTTAGAFVTLIPVPPGFGPPSGTVAGTIPSAFASGAAAKTEMRFGNTPSLPPVIGGGTRFVIHMDGNTRDIELPTPIILDEDAYVSVIGSTVGAAEILYVNASVLELAAA